MATCMPLTSPFIMSWLRSTNTWRAGVALVGLLALAACDKGTELGVDLPEVADINAQFLDLELSVSTVQYDSVQTLKSDHFLAGRLRDGIAGTTTATAVLNLEASTLLDSLPSKFPGVTLDSVVFVQGFDLVYGSSAAPAVFDLMRLTVPLSETAPYTASSVPPLNPTPVASNMSTRLDRIIKTVNHGPDSSAATKFIYTPDPTIRLMAYKPGSTNVNPVFQSLFSAMKATTVFGQAQLEQQLAGLAVVPSAGYEQAILSFTRNTQSKLGFYFSVHGGTGTPKWHSYNVYYGPTPGTGAAKASDPRYYTYFESDKTGTLLAPLAQLNGAATVSAAALNNLSYVQDGIGLGTRLEFGAQLKPLRDLKDKNKNVAINRAELFIPVKPFSNALWPNVNGLFALEVNQNNQVLQRTSGLTAVERIVQRSGAAPTGVNNEAIAVLYDAKTTAPYFNLDITNYLQAYLNDQLGGPLPAALVLLPTVRRSQNLTLNRSVLEVGGTGRAPRLRVYYSELR